MGSSVPRDIHDYLDEIASDAVARSGMPEAVARYAANATLRAIDGGCLAGSRQHIRCSAYFWAVARRRLVRTGGPSKVSARLVLSTVVDDLLGAGRDTDAVWSEIERGWAGRVSPEILEEYRVRLCA